MLFGLLWVGCTILYTVIYHKFFTVVYFGVSGFLRTLAKTAALGLFTAYFISAFAIKHPFISIGIAIVIIAIIVLGKRSSSGGDS